jgi:hypothetical protein
MELATCGGSLQDKGAEILQAHQLLQKLETVRLKTVLSCDDMAWNEIFLKPVQKH